MNRVSHGAISLAISYLRCRSPQLPHALFFSFFFCRTSDVVTAKLQVKSHHAKQILPVGIKVYRLKADLHNRLLLGRKSVPNFLLFIPSRILLLFLSPQERVSHARSRRMEEGLLSPSLPQNEKAVIEGEFPRFCVLVSL